MSIENSTALGARATLHPRHGIHAPTASTPPRAPGTLRRTATTDMLRPDGLLGELVLVGRARDLWTDARGQARVLGEAGYEARVAYLALREIREIRSEPQHPAAQTLVGARATSGFRAALDAALPAERDARSLLYLLLDDLPVAALVSGYAMGFAFGSSHPVPKRHLRLQHPDLCAGWRTGGTILVEMERTERVPIVTGPEAKPLAREGDPLAWHALPPLPPNGMRRHRRLDLTSGERLGVDALFRDSHVAPDGRETIVHEYTVTASVDPEELTFDHIEATARALPWVECNPAAASASRLVGRPVRGLRQKVRAEFTGTSTCTHLNDTLRSLEDIEALAGVLARLRNEGA
jgi:hypothetical protein